MTRFGAFIVCLGLALAGCATDPGNDPHSGGFFGGVRGLTSGDYDARQQQLHGERNQSLNELRALREENESLESTRRMKADEVAVQRRELASLKARNQAMARRIDQLARSKSATERHTAQLRHQQQQKLAQNIRKFESDLDMGQLTATQANARRLSLEREYDAIKEL